MRFFYASFLSQALWVVYCLIAIPLAWLIWRGISGKLTILGACATGVITAALPWSEEWWIAYQFDTLCRRDAGIAIAKTVNVPGFFDGVNGWGVRQLSESEYQFIEWYDILSHRLMRVERGVDAVLRDTALERYYEKHPRDERRSKYVSNSISEKEQIIVSPNEVDAWRVTVIDKPTARYHYKRIDYGKTVAHKIARSEDLILDTQTNEVLARRVDYGRGPYWFFVSLDNATMSCKETLMADQKYRSPLISRVVLLPGAN